ncbi:MAG: hypothetical protein PHF35_00775 [Candidatus Moranbacteria bacterium]|nr:hypothetical protein [Candidatus Moranbacteria bacterium]
MKKKDNLAGKYLFGAFQNVRKQLMRALMFKNLITEGHISNLARFSTIAKLIHQAKQIE